MNLDALVILFMIFPGTSLAMSAVFDKICRFRSRACREILQKRAASV
jgi:hypothetical protein